MTEAEWAASTQLATMLQELHQQARPRKFQLFACACLRQLWDHTRSLAFRKSVVFAERYIEQQITREELRAAFVVAWPWGWERLRVTAVVTVAPLERDLHRSEERRVGT